jgi:hypothetical protein
LDELNPFCLELGKENVDDPTVKPIFINENCNPSLRSKRSSKATMVAKPMFIDAAANKLRHGGYGGKYMSFIGSMISPDEDRLPRRRYSCADTSNDERSIKVTVEKIDSQRSLAPKLDLECSSRRFSCGECTRANLRVKDAVRKRTRMQEDWVEDRSTRTAASKLILEQKSTLASRRRDLPILMLSA